MQRKMERIGVKKERKERAIVRWPMIGGTRVKKKEWKIAMQRKIGENRSKESERRKSNSEVTHDWENKS